MISSNLKWHEHVDLLSKRGNKKLWLLRRLKSLGAPKHILINLYFKQIRSILEYAAPVWSPGLTLSDKDDLERIQKSAFKIIFSYENYEKMLNDYNLQSLEDRRVEICRKFADKSAKNVRFKSWFQVNCNPYNTRNVKFYKEIFCRTNAWKRSPIPYMTELLNNPEV